MPVQCQRFLKWWHHLNGHTWDTIDGGHRNVKTNPLPQSMNWHNGGSGVRTLVPTHPFPVPGQCSVCWVCCVCVSDVVTLCSRESVNYWIHANHTFIRLIKCNLWEIQWPWPRLHPALGRQGGPRHCLFGSRERVGGGCREISYDNGKQLVLCFVQRRGEERPLYDEKEDPGDVTGTLRKREDVNILYDKCHCITNSTCHGNASHHIPLHVTMHVSSSLWRIPVAKHKTDSCYLLHDL